MPDPIFSADDRVNGELPVELQGKTPTEIARYYADRETRLRAELTPPPKGDPPPKSPTTAEFWEKPEASVRQIAQDEFARMTQDAQQTVIASAKMICKDNHSDDVTSGIWKELEPQLITVVNNLPSYQRASVGMWETAYTHVKGMNADRLIKAARESSTRASSEIPTAPITIEAPKEINFEGWPKEKVDKMLEGLSLSKEQYLAAGHRSDHGTWPMTFSNVRRERKSA